MATGHTLRSMVSTTPTERFSLKDHLFNPQTVGWLAGLLADVDPAFDRDGFEAEVLSAMPELELKQRISMIAEVLATHLPEDFEQAAGVIASALPPPLDPSLSDDDFGEFVIAPLGDYVARWGLDPADYETSVALLKELTMRCSMEGYIRPFLTEYPDETLSRLTLWADDPNYHVRRLVSEGTRPTLPWAPRIPMEIGTPIPLLDKLHADPTRYVTRSVSNHLNDISKIDSALAISTLERWHETGLQDSKELDWMTRHALRSLIKQGDPKAMQLLGYSPNPAISVDSLVVNAPGGVVRIGDVLEFEVTITAGSDERLLVDYVIDFVKKNGDRRSKVFKLRTIEMTTGEKRTLEKKHRLPASATTFTLYPGMHAVSVKVNGNVLARTEFELVV